RLGATMGYPEAGSLPRGSLSFSSLSVAVEKLANVPVGVGSTEHGLSGPAYAANVEREAQSDTQEALPAQDNRLVEIPINGTSTLTSPLHISEVLADSSPS